MKKMILAIAPLMFIGCFIGGVLTQSWLGFFLLVAVLPVVGSLLMWGIWKWFDFVDRRF